MKKFFLVLFLCALQVRAISVRETFLQANLSFEQGDYTKAIDLYEKIEQKGHAVWFNMGNCYYQLNDPEAACICFKKSLQGSSYSQCMDVLERIDQIQNAHSSLFKKLYTVITSRPTGYFQFLFLFFWLLLCGLFFRFGLIIRIPLMCALVLTIIPLSMSTLKKEHALSKQITCLYVGPDETLPSLSQVDKGQEFIVEEHKNDWCKVRADRCKGWIKKEHIVLV